MPVAEFPGHHGWGYDGVYLSAAHSAYGGPHGLQRFVDAAHAAGLGVILDVVYNHVGASGVKALEAFGPYFTERHETPWGKAVNYDGEGSDGVREWVLQSATGWVRDFHVDGLRLDAIHAIHDDGARHVLRELAERVRAVHRRALVIAESGLNDPKVIRPPARAATATTPCGPTTSTTPCTRCSPASARAGTRSSGRWRSWPRPSTARTSTTAATRPSAGGASAPAPTTARPSSSSSSTRTTTRSATAPSATGCRRSARPLAAFCTLLAPFTPMLFMGEEHGERAPFQFFSDHIDKRMADATREGRRQEFAAFAEFAGEEVPDPQDPATFERSKLTRRGSTKLRALYAALLRARRALPPGVDSIEFSEDDGWLRVRRGAFELACNFAAGPRTVPVRGAHAWRSPRTARRSATAACACPRARER